VTVAAACAADAEAAATLIANAVDLPGSPKVRRAPACDIDPDSDLGGRLVTVDVASLDRAVTLAALARGAACARAMLARGLIDAAALCVDGEVALVGEGGRLTLAGHALGEGAACA
jgi:hypothetical protein